MSGLSATPGVELTISWSPPSEPNGHITMYQISYNTGVEYNTSATQHTLRDLPPNTVVVFSVRAYTNIGPGENVTDQASTTSVRKQLSLSFTMLSLCIPSAARVTGVTVVALNSTAVNVSWTPVTLQETVYHYTVHYTTVSQYGTTNNSYPASASSGVVSRLQEGQQYQFSVTLTFNVSGAIYTYAGRELKLNNIA